MRHPTIPAAAVLLATVAAFALSAPRLAAGVPGAFASPASPGAPSSAGSPPAAESGPSAPTAVEAATPAPPRRRRPAAGSFAVRASTVHLTDGTTLEDGVLWVEDGAIRAVGRGVEPAEGVPVIEHEGSLTAGLVAAHSFLGTGRVGVERKRAIFPEGRLVHAFAPAHGDFERARAAGITAVALAPRAETLVGGRIAVVKTAGGTVVEDAGPLHVALTAGALSPVLEPTSFPGALARLDRHLGERRGAFADVAEGSLPVVIEAWERHEVARALAFARRHGLTGAVRGARRAGELAGRFADSGLVAIVGPFAPGTPREELRSVVELAEAGVPVAFALDGPDHAPESLRLAAAMCVREGLDPVIALRGLTRTPAEALGVGGRVGRLERGLDADFVLWSGPPLELASRVEAVYVGGERVDGGER